MVDLLCRWAPLDAVAEFGAPTATVALAWVLSVRGRKGFGQERERGGKVSTMLVSIGTMGSPDFLDVGHSTPLQITENDIIKVSLAILGYGGPDL